jgi:serpin B
MRFKYALMFVFLSIFLSGCSDSFVPLDDQGAMPEGVAKIVEGNNKFAFDMYAELSNGENLFFSPHSISSALGMVYEGAKGETASEIRDVFYFPEDDIERKSSFAAVYNQINKADKEYKLNTANALWSQQDYVFLDEYFENVEKYYGGKVTNMDFVGNSEESRIIINDWVEGKTNGKIKDLIEFLSPDTRLVLTNAVYFKGDWLYEFDKDDTKEWDFTLSDGQDVKVDMMFLDNEEAKFNYYGDEDLQLLEMPYKGEEISMLVLLPGESISELENVLSYDKLNEWRSQMNKVEVPIYLPKFTFETKYQTMGTTLAGMGMPSAFNSGAADFSGMTGSRDLFISQVIHQAFVEVNEKGTEAAAATAVVMELAAIMDPLIFEADHPFIFIIQDRESGNILFMGKVEDPRS